MALRTFGRLLLVTALFLAPSCHPRHGVLVVAGDTGSNEDVDEDSSSDGVPTSSGKTAQEKQDVFLQCLNSMFHADKDLDDALNMEEYKLFLKYFSSQLYPHPIFHDGYVTQQIRELFKILVQASGNGERGISINVYGSKIEQMPNLEEEQFDTLQSMCSMTENAFKLLASRTESPKVMVFQFEMMEPRDGDSGDGMHVKIKPLLRETGQARHGQQPKGLFGPGDKERTPEDYAATEEPQEDDFFVELRKEMDELEGNNTNTTEPDGNLTNTSSILDEYLDALDAYLNNDTNLNNDTAPAHHPNTTNATFLNSTSNGDVLVLDDDDDDDSVFNVTMDDDIVSSILQNETSPDPILNKSNVVQAINATNDDVFVDDDTFDDDGVFNSTTDIIIYDDDYGGVNETTLDKPNTTAPEVGNVTGATNETNETTLPQLHSGFTSNVTINANSNSSGTSFDDDDAIAWNESYREIQYQKNKKELEEWKKQVLKEKKRIHDEHVAKKKHDKDAAKAKAPQRKKEAEEEQHDKNVTRVPHNDTNTTGLHLHINTSSLPLHLNMTKLHMHLNDTEPMRPEDDDDDDKDDLVVNSIEDPYEYIGNMTIQFNLTTETDSDVLNLTMDELLNEIFDDDDDDTVVIDEDGEDSQILSIHTSFIISNTHGKKDVDVPINSDSTLHKAFGDFVVLLIGTVCDKAGVGRNYGNCTVTDHTEASKANMKESKEDKAVEPDERQRRLLHSGERELVEGAKFRERHGVKFDYTVLNPELYEILDVDCPVRIAGLHDMLQCQTVYAHYNLLLKHLDGHLEEIEKNYMMITWKGIREGRLDRSLLVMNPETIFAVEGIGHNVFPSSHRHHGVHGRDKHKKKAGAAADANGQNETDTESRRRIQSAPEDDLEDLYLAELLAEEGHRPQQTRSLNREGTGTSDEEDLIESAKRTKNTAGGWTSSAVSSSSKLALLAILIALINAAGILL
ncbi:expressed unknown protein [Seminavis robusta]|uniref:EF-hand domain-containing protein n=1 Tax=Seminavis robusta TaxID=568900 RepID=A0A9N8DZM9_9STRA|nr:expressed unknown protein [Seminavis robusta]|eukprot:Sro505_g156220.1 n/a (966) ;mRNA; f:54192-57584